MCVVKFQEQCPLESPCVGDSSCLAANAGLGFGSQGKRQVESVRFTGYGTYRKCNRQLYCIKCKILVSQTLLIQINIFMGVRYQWLINKIRPINTHYLSNKGYTLFYKILQSYSYKQFLEVNILYYFHSNIFGMRIKICQLFLADISMQNKNMLAFSKQ